MAESCIKKPNILVIGTPGTGKTALCKKLSKKLNGYKRIELSKAIKKHRLYYEWDDKMNASIFDEKLVRKFLKVIINKYNSKNIGIILDFHSTNFISNKWFDIVVCLNSETQVLYDRLKLRKYSEDKIRENVECEIFKVVKYDAEEIFGEHKIMELSSNTIKDQSSNIQIITSAVRDFEKC
ncbi:putative nucleotide kinase [Cryptosporidium bovis]|uniref:putative nucleotide kinase n=1 Tax=Cryptosporidium bovis TaxID=310047 RepID=UPI00351A394B|nr:putative nucleotide kinase [Cryptosporidium bovis]